MDRNFQSRQDSSQKPMEKDSVSVLETLVFITFPEKM